MALLHAHPSPGVLLPYLPVVAATAFGAGAVVLAGLLALRRSPFRIGLVLIWTVLPLVAVTLLSLRNAKVFNPRYMILALPLWLCVAGLGVERLVRGRRVAGRMAVLLLLGMTLTSLHLYFHDGRYGREDTRGAAALLEAEARTGDIILAEGVPQVLHWYYRGPVPLQRVVEFDVRTEERLSARLATWLEGRRRVWLFICRPWLQDPEDRLKHVLDRIAGPGKERRFDGVRLILYDLPGTD